MITPTPLQSCNATDTPHLHQARILGRATASWECNACMQHASAVSALACLLLSTANGQEFRASITGEITDATGSPVPKVRVVATNVETNVASEALTNESGRYTIGF